MHILRLSTFSLGLAAVLGLLVGWSSPASAHCKSDGHNSRPGHEDCGDPPPPGITYTVEVITDTSIGNGVDTTRDPGQVGCVGTTTPSSHLNINYVTDNRIDCGPVKINHENAVFDIYLLQIPVKETNKKTTVTFFFTSCVTPGLCGNEFVYHTGPLLAKITRNNDGTPKEITGIGGSWSNVVLVKAHQPLKGFLSSAATAISIGTIIYTAK